MSGTVNIISLLVVSR